MLMEYWSIAPEELERPLRGPRRAPPTATTTSGVKYRHPETGETWDGDGAHPQWLRDALLKQGYTVAQLRAAAEAPQEDAPRS